jgi:hypothetical protein
MPFSSKGAHTRIDASPDHAFIQWNPMIVFCYFLSTSEAVVHHNDDDVILLWVSKTGSLRDSGSTAPEAVPKHTVT